jgi:aminomethyltransferase
MPDEFKQFLVESRGGRLDPSGSARILDFGNPEREYHALTGSAALLDLNVRGRACLLGPDRKSFLHGQVTNHIKQLEPGEGCQAALVTAKGKVEADLNVYCLEEELLLDFEPNLTGKVIARLEKYIIADDVQVVDVSPHFGLISAQGPLASQVLARAGLQLAPGGARAIQKIQHPGGFEIYAAHLARFGSDGWDFFYPVEQEMAFAEQLEKAVGALGGSWAGEAPARLARVESGIPQFGADFDESNLAPETGLEIEAIHYNKGCYIGQEVIARIRTYGQVAKALRVLRFEGIAAAPKPRQKLLRNGKEAGYVTSAVFSPRFQAIIGLGYARKEANKPGDILELDGGEGTAVVVGPPVYNKGFSTKMTQ